MLWQRLISAFILITIFTFALIYPGNIGRSLIFIMSSLFIYLAISEIHEMMKKIESPFKKEPVIFAGIAFLSCIFVDSQIGWSLEFYFIPFILIFSWFTLLFSKCQKNFIRELLNTFMILLFLVFPLSFLLKIYLIQDASNYTGCWLFAYLVACSKIGDTGGYFFGTSTAKLMKNGNHKIVPSISPKKSWEGTLGGLISSTLMAYFLGRYLFPNLPEWIFWGFGFILFWGGFAGDLVESVLKRAAEVKDAGKSLPGMGGVLDLVDSFLINAPLFWVLYQIMIKYGFNFQ